MERAAYMENVAPLLKRTYEEINRNRKRLLLAAYDVYPEYMYCDPDQFNWYESDARTNIFDLYYLSDSGYVHLTVARRMDIVSPNFSCSPGRCKYR